MRDALLWLVIAIDLTVIGGCIYLLMTRDKPAKQVKTFADTEWSTFADWERELDMAKADGAIPYSGNRHKACE